ncbi:MAG: hypothetical protein JKX81_08550 [Arenicella sp.]|nr:hypothetical protein [Arenicella sp.]
MKYIVPTLLILAGLNMANASEHTEKMCAKIKECALSQAAGNQIPEQLKDIIIQMVDSQCGTMANRYDASFAEAGLQELSNACVDSIVEQSCGDLLVIKGTPNTKACKEFETVANEAGVELIPDLRDE